MLAAFDLPVPMTTMGKRSVSSVPAQALTLLNDPFVVEQAQVWAKRSPHLARWAGAENQEHVRSRRSRDLPIARELDCGCGVYRRANRRFA